MSPVDRGRALVLIVGRHRLVAWLLTVAVALTAGGLAVRSVVATDRTPVATTWFGGTAPSPGSVDGAAPTRLRIPAIGVETSPLLALRRDASGALETPADYALAGWYADGTLPGDAGPAVIAGHVDSERGPAVFFRLHELRAGETVEVARGERWVAFRVVAVRTYAKDAFPTAEVYGPTPVAELRLITCGGAFDSARRSYADNVVAYAVAV